MGPLTAGDAVHAGDANPAELLRRIDGVSRRHGRVRVESFYSYDGSLTTPACTEGVRWSVLADGGRVSKAAVARFHKLIRTSPATAATRTTTARCNRSTDGWVTCIAHDDMTEPPRSHSLAPSTKRSKREKR